MRPRSTLETTGVALALAAATFAVHVAVAGRYDFFRDELYFIVCGRHPAFGYVDQPPLIPLWAAFSQSFGENLVLLRLPAALAGGATVYVACALARLAGGGRFAECLAGLAAAIAPMLLGLAYLLTTGAFEPLAWTLCAYLVARSIVCDDPRALIWLGLVAGCALEAKYALPFYLAALALGLALTPQRRIFSRRELAIGTIIALVIGAPSIAWQAAHGWPFVELLRSGSAGKNVVLAPPAFVLNQIVVLNPLFAPLWLSGIAAPFAIARLQPLRPLAIGFAATFALMVALHAKDYYLAPAYPAMFALGAVAFETWVTNAIARTAYAVVATAVAAVLAPFALPILAPAPLIAYMHALRLAPSTNEQSQAGTTLPPVFADQLGWRAFERNVAGIYSALPPGERAQTAIVTSNYGEAAALDVYGGPDGLPPAISGHNTYALWGTHGYDGASLLYINSIRPEFWVQRCRTATVVGTFGSPYALPYENGRKIVWCRGLRQPLSELLSDDLQHYD